MEVVFNFESKELVIKSASNVKELWDKLKVILDKDMKNWTIVSDIVYRNNDWWYYKPYRTYPWYDWETIPGRITCGDSTDGTVYCLSDSNSSETIIKN